MFKHIIQHLPDAKIVRAIRHGDEDAFKTLYNKYFERLCAFAGKMGLRSDEVKCLIQEVFLTTWNNRELLDENQSIQAYLHTIAKRSAIKLIKRKALEEQYLAQRVATSHQQTEDYIIFTNLMDHTQKELEKMSPARKQIFMLSRQQGLTNDEIAERLNLSRRTVENQLYRATKELKDMLGSDLAEK